MEEEKFNLEFKVRDYECDLQGIVNNAVYQHYLEHARHEFLTGQGISFSGLSEKGIDLVVIRVEIDYKSPLRSGDSFTVDASLEQISPLRFCFNQTICKLPGNKLVVKARVYGTSINKKGKPFLPEELKSAFSKILDQNIL